MKIEGVEKLTHPPQLVFVTLRDKTTELARFMPNIRSMEILRREEQDGVVHMYNRWQGTNKDVPAIARPFISDDLLAWFDDAHWDEKTLGCRWRIDSVKAKEIFECSGTTGITPHTDGPGCTFTLTAELTIHADKVPGVPRFLANKLREPIERFIANSLRPNLTSIAGAVQRYLDEQAPA